MRRTQGRVLLRVTSLRSRGPPYWCATHQLPRNPAPHHSFLPRAVLATFVAGVLFLLVVRFLPRRSFSIATSAPTLNQLVRSGSLISYQQIRVITVIQIFLLSSQSLFQHNRPNFSSHSLTRLGPVILHGRLLLYLQILPFRRGSTLPQGQSLHFS
jgi:hypothetical protein